MKTINSFLLCSALLPLFGQNSIAADFATEASYVSHSRQRTFPAAIAEKVLPQNQDEDAERLKRRLGFLNMEITTLEESIRANSVFYHGGAAELSGWKPGSKEAIKAGREAAAYLKSATRRESELVFEAAILSDELNLYHRTGILSAPDEKRIKWIKDQLDHPFPNAGSVPELSLDINVLQRQLRYYDHLFGRSAARTLPDARPAIHPGARPMRRATDLSKIEPRIRAQSNAKPRNEIEYAGDAGTGKAAIDPIPALIDQLSSRNPIERALAADELAHQHEVSRATQALLRAVGDEDPRVRSSAALALGAADSPQEAVIRVLKKAARDQDADVRFSAQRALSQLAVRGYR